MKWMAVMFIYVVKGKVKKLGFVCFLYVLR